MFRMAGLFGNREASAESARAADPVANIYGASSSSPDFALRIQQRDGLSAEIAAIKADLIRYVESRYLERQSAPSEETPFLRAVRPLQNAPSEDDMPRLRDIRPPQNRTQDGERLWAEAERQLSLGDIRLAHEYSLRARLVSDDPDYQRAMGALPPQAALELRSAVFERPIEELPMALMLLEQRYERFSGASDYLARMVAKVEAYNAAIKNPEVDLDALDRMLRASNWEEFEKNARMVLNEMQFQRVMGLASQVAAETGGGAEIASVTQEVLRQMIETMLLLRERLELDKELEGKLKEIIREARENGGLGEIADRIPEEFVLKFGVDGDTKQILEMFAGLREFDQASVERIFTERPGLAAGLGEFFAS